MSRIAYIGLGSMGAPQARLLAREGHIVSVYDPFPAALDAFNGLARLAVSPADAAADAEVACICVRDDQQVRDVIFGANGLVEGLAPGTLILVHSTISIATLFDLQKQLQTRSIALIDAPVSRTRRTDDDRFVFTMIGGTAEEAQRAQTIVEAFSTEADHIGPLGAAMAAKIANNLVTWVQIIVGDQAMSLAQSNGVPYAKLRSIMQANGNLTPTMGATLEGRYGGAPVPAGAAEFRASQAGIGEKDLSLAADTAAAAGIDIQMIEAGRNLVRAVMTGAASKA